jgi:hypothetical protein
MIYETPISFSVDGTRNQRGLPVFLGRVRVPVQPCILDLRVRYNKPDLKTTYIMVYKHYLDT